MVWVTEGQSTGTIQSLVEQILASGQMNRIQHIQLASAILTDLKISNEERRQINRVFDYLQTGRVRLVD